MAGPERASPLSGVSGSVIWKTAWPRHPQGRSQLMALQQGGWHVTEGRKGTGWPAQAAAR